jgi:hypothetical protein
MRKPKVQTKIKSTGFAAAALGQAPRPSLPTVGVDLPVLVLPPPMIFIRASIATNVNLSRVIEAEVKAVGTQEIEKIMNTMAANLKAALKVAIQSSVWAWSSGGARDIYDKGRLANSGDVRVEGLSLAVTYGAPYASLVHDGGYILPYGNSNARPVYLPGRPWVASTIYGGGPVPRFNFRDEIRKLV